MTDVEPLREAMFTEPTRDTVLVVARNAAAKRMHGEDWEQCAEGSEVLGGHGMRRVFHGPQADRLAAHDMAGRPSQLGDLDSSPTAWPP